MGFRFLSVCAAAVGVGALSGCAGSGSQQALPGGAALQSAATTQSIAFGEGGFVEPAVDGVATIGVRLNGETAVIDKHYGKLLGYARGTVTKTTHVVTLTRGQSVVFTNADASDEHTASFLGDASKQKAPWPTSFNGSSTQSAAGTDISTKGFSTGPLTPGKSSLKYVANVPGFYMFGCAFHYDFFGMRDIVIVK